MSELIPLGRFDGLHVRRNTSSACSSACVCVCAELYSCVAFVEHAITEKLIEAYTPNRQPHGQRAWKNMHQARRTNTPTALTQAGENKSIQMKILCIRSVSRLSTTTATGPIHSLTLFICTSNPLYSFRFNRSEKHGCGKNANIISIGKCLIKKLCDWLL